MLKKVLLLLSCRAAIDNHELDLILYLAHANYLSEIKSTFCEMGCSRGGLLFSGIMYATCLAHIDGSGCFTNGLLGTFGLQVANYFWLV